MTILEASKHYGINYKTIYRRIHTLKWDKDIAYTTPLVTPRSYRKILNKAKSAPVKEQQLVVNKLDIGFENGAKSIQR